MNGYVILEAHWQYDDNYYFSPEYGSPSKIFLNLDEAKAFIAKKNQEWFRDLVEENQVWEYNYGDSILSETLSEEDLDNLTQKYFQMNSYDISSLFSNGNPFDDDFMKEILGFIDNNWEEFSKIFHYNLVNNFEIVEVEIAHPLS